MGFRDDIMRVPLFGLGCAGGVSGLSTAQVIASGRPGAKVVDARAGALHPKQGSLVEQRDTLRAAGNMSAPTGCLR
jgi:predicted naringenin-chalcone synthase